MKLPLLESIAMDQSLLAEAAAGSDWEVTYTYKDTDGSTCSGGIVVKNYADADRAKAAAVSKIVKKYPDAKVKSVKEVIQAADSGERVNWTVKYSFDDPSGKGTASGTAQIIAGKSKPELMSSAGVKKLAKNRKNFKITRSSIVKEEQMAMEAVDRDSTVGKAAHELTDAELHDKIQAVSKSHREWTGKAKQGRAGAKDRADAILKQLKVLQAQQANRQSGFAPKRP